MSQLASPSKDVSKSSAEPEEKHFSRLSVESLIIFAESRGLTVSNVDRDGWSALSEDLNYRIRQLANLSAKFMKLNKRNRLCIGDVNDALKEFNQQPIYGQGSGDAPKVHLVRDQHFYVPNDGVVDLAPLALNRYFVPAIQEQSNIQGTRLALVENETQETNSNEQIPAEFKSLLAELHSILNSEFCYAVDKALVDFVRNKYPQTLQAITLLCRLLLAELSKSPKVLCGVCVLLEYLINNYAAQRHIIEQWISELCKSILENVTSLPDELWSVDTCSCVAATLKAVQRYFGCVSGCDYPSQLNHLLTVLKNPKESPLAYTSALIILKLIAFPALSKCDILSLFSQHYKWNRVVFETTEPLEAKEWTLSLARTFYVGAWKDLLEWYLSRLIKIFYWQQTNNPDCPELDTQCLGEILKIATEAFGNLNIQLLDFQLLFDTSKTQNISSLDPLIGHKSLDQISKRPASPEKPSTPDVEINEKIEKPPSVSKRQFSAASKKRKRRVQDAFENLKKSRHQRKDFIFVFHETDAKVHIREHSVAKNVCKPVSAWYKWLSGKKEKRKVFGKQKPLCAQLNEVVF